MRTSGKSVVEPIAEMTRRLASLYRVDEDAVIAGVLHGMRRSEFQRASFSRVATALESMADRHAWHAAVARLLA